MELFICVPILVQMCQKMVHGVDVRLLVIWITDYDHTHYNDGIMGSIACQIKSLPIVNSAVYSGAHQRKHQRPASLAFVRGIHRGPVKSPHKWPVTRNMFLFDDVIMSAQKNCQMYCLLYLYILLICKRRNRNHNFILLSIPQTTFSKIIFVNENIWILRTV